MLAVGFLIRITEAARPWSMFEQAVESQSLGENDERYLKEWEALEESKKIGALSFLMHTVDVNFPTRVLDAGTGEGYALQRLETFFKWLDFHDVVVDGLDDLSKYRGTLQMPEKYTMGHIGGKPFKWRYIYTDNEERDYKDERSLEKAVEIEFRTGHRLWWLEVERAHRYIPYKYDFIFVSAPPTEKESIKKFAEGSFRLLKDAGIMFWRFPQGRSTLENVNELRKWIQEHNYYVIMRSSKGVIPDGWWDGDIDGESFLDGHMTFIIRKRHWDSPEAQGDSLGKLINAAFERILFSREIQEAA